MTAFGACTPCTQFSIQSLRAAQAHEYLYRAGKKGRLKKLKRFTNAFTPRYYMIGGLRCALRRPCAGFLHDGGRSPQGCPGGAGDTSKKKIEPLIGGCLHTCVQAQGRPVGRRLRYMSFPLEDKKRLVKVLLYKSIDSLLLYICLQQSALSIREKSTQRFVNLW